MASKDEKVVKDSMEKADDILKNLPKKSKIKKTNSDNDEVSSDEVEDADDVTDGRGDGDGKKKKKKSNFFCFFVKHFSDFFYGNVFQKFSTEVFF